MGEKVYVSFPIKTTIGIPATTPQLSPLPLGEDGVRSN
jgi:hypothetical protein